MNQQPITRESLLVRLIDPDDQAAWDEFVSIYWPLVFGIARRRGLQHSDAEDVCQDVLCAVEARATHFADGTPQGGFRRWLAAVARNVAIDAIRRVRPDTPKGGTSANENLQHLKSRDDSNLEFENELEKQAFRWAANRVRHEFQDSTWDAFWTTMIDGVPCDVVAKQLGKSVGAIYTARSRIMQRIKEEVELFNWGSE